MDFGWALNALRAGGRVYREGWGSNHAFLYLVPSSVFEVNRPPLLGIYAEGTKVHYRSHIDLRAESGTCAPWMATHADLLATDWRSRA